MYVFLSEKKLNKGNFYIPFFAFVNIVNTRTRILIFNNITVNNINSYQCGHLYYFYKKSVNSTSNR